MVDDLDAGRRPLVRDGADTSAALQVCPGVGLEHGDPPRDAIRSLLATWGPVLEVWEGHAADDAIRYAGSSGGAATALALSALDAGCHAVLHIRARSDLPVLNETVLSTTRESLLSGAGSRYAPASPCDRLDLVRDAPQPCVFIGKPCDVAATARARRTDAELDVNLGLTIAIFCAGTPTLRGTMEMLDRMGVSNIREVGSLRYRGNGWPGEAQALLPLHHSSESIRSLSYEESWGAILQRHRQWRCYVCVDHTGEFADIAVGDPWYRDPSDGELGSNLILVRTERGRQAFTRARERGHIVARQVDGDLVSASQPGLRRVRGAVWGRLMASRIMGIPAPVYRRMPTFREWVFHLSLRERAQSFFGLIRRIRRRGLRGRHPVRPLDTDCW
jgi:coenzyme F420 hydrogenase subunit beta